MADLAETAFSPPVLSDYNGSPNTRFSRGTTRLMIRPDGGALFVPSAIPCSLSPLISCIHSCLFSHWRRTVSSKFLDTQVPSISNEELVLPRLARCLLSRYAATDTAFCKALIYLRLAESRILPVAPVDTRSRTPLISFCTVQLWTLCAARLQRLPISLRSLVQALERCPACGAPRSSAMPHPSKGIG